MKKTLQEQWRSILLTTAGVAMVFGISFLFFSSQQGETIPDPDPTIVEKDVLRPAAGGSGPGGDAKPNGPVIVSPSSINVENASVGLELPPINVQNQSTQERRLEFDFVPIYRTSDQGIPVIQVDEESLQEGRGLVSIEPSGQYVIGPGQSIAVKPTIIGRTASPTLAGSIGVRIVGDFGETSDPEKQGVRTRIRQDVRLSAILTAVFPGGKSDAVDVNNVRAEATGGAGRMRANVELRSRGDIPSPVYGEVLLRQGNRVIQRKDIAENSVLPGQRETLSTEQFTGVKPGDYVLEARMRYGRDRRGQSVSRPLQVSSEGIPAVPEADATVSLNKTLVKPGSPVSLSVRMRNTGEKAFAPEASIGVYSYDSNKPIQTLPVALEAVEPGASSETEVSTKAPRKPGSYSYTLTVRAESGELLYEGGASLDVGSAESPDKSLVDAARDWFSDNPEGGIAAGIILVGLLLFIIVGAITIIQRARR